MGIDQWRSKFIAQVFLAVFLLYNLLFAFAPTGNTDHENCVYWEGVVIYWEQRVVEAEYKLQKVKDKGYIKTMQEHSNAGLVGGLIVGGGLGAILGPPGIIAGAAKFGITGGVGGMFTGFLAHRKAVKAAEDELDYVRSMLELNKGYLEDCRRGHREEHEKRDRQQQTPPMTPTPSPDGSGSQDPMNNGGGRF